MNKIIAIAALTLVALVSCNKEKEVIKPEQRITYNVECDYCLVYIEDNVWNRTNALERSKNQHFAVNGKWKYEFTNTKLDSVEMMISVSVMGGKQKLKASISTNDGKITSINELMGYNNDPTKEDYGFDRSLKLQLK